jgi:hypothetical protein
MSEKEFWAQIGYKALKVMAYVIATLVVYFMLSEQFASWMATLPDWARLAMIPGINAVIFILKEVAERYGKGVIGRINGNGDPNDGD